MPRFQGCALGPSVIEQKLGAVTVVATKRYRGSNREKEQRQKQTQKETAAKVMSIRKAERR